MTSIYDLHAGSPIQEFKLDRQIIPASIIREIYYLLRRDGYWSASEEKFQEHCIAAIGVDWVSSEGEYTGKFTKRLSKWYYEKSGRWAAYNELPEEVISNIGNLIGKAKPPTDIYWDVPKDNWSWDLTSFSHRSSCYRPGAIYQNLPYIFNKEGVFSIRFYDRIENSLLGGYSPVGRVWVKYFEAADYPFYIIFNGYGYNLSIIAYFMSHQFNLPEVKKIKVLNKGVWDGEIWINEGNGFALSDTKFNLDNNTYDLNINTKSYTKSCRNCGASFIPNFLNQKISESFQRTVVSIKRGINSDNINASFKTYQETKNFCSNCYTEDNFWYSSVYEADLYIDYAIAYTPINSVADQGWDQNMLIRVSHPQFFSDVREAFNWAKENVGEKEAYLDSGFLEKLYKEFKENGVTYFYGLELLRLGFTTNVKGAGGFVSYKDIDYLYISEAIMKKFTGTNSERFSKITLKADPAYYSKSFERAFPGVYYFSGDNIFKLTQCFYTKFYFPRYHCIYAPDGHWYSEYGLRKAISEGYFKGLIDLLELDQTNISLKINIRLYKKESVKSSSYSRAKLLENVSIPFVEYLENYFKKNKFITQGVSL